jgi:hypothetical protein
MGAGFQLAQINVARLNAPLDDPAVADFRNGIDVMNALAEGSPGFVWRGTGEGFDSEPGGDPMLVNVSVWESIELLAAFAYRTDHRHFVRRGHEWFERPAEAHLALWWTPAGRFPTLTEAMGRIDHLRRHGPTPHAFTFAERFAAPSPQLETVS